MHKKIKFSKPVNDNKKVVGSIVFLPRWNIMALIENRRSVWGQQNGSIGIVPAELSGAWSNPTGQRNRCVYVPRSSNRVFDSPTRESWNGLIKTEQNKIKASLEVNQRIPQMESK